VKILFATSECVPFVKTGGLADVLGSLPKALKQLDPTLDVRVVLPLYEDIPQKYRDAMRFIGSKYVPLGYKNNYCGVFAFDLEGITYYFLDNEFFFKRGGLYGFFDDGERFAFFSKAVLESMQVTGFYPDVLHVNDWQTAIAPLFLDAFYRLTDGYKTMKTVLSVHNIEFQGRMDKYCIDHIFGLSGRFYSEAEYKGDTNMLKAGIEASNKVITVSPSYAEEILYPYYSYGLENILNARKFKLSGIVNGIDLEKNNPENNKNIVPPFSVNDSDLEAKKKANKDEVLKILGLETDTKKEVPLIAMITRLTHQKGIDLFIAAHHEILKQDVKIVVLGTGEWKYESALREIEATYPAKFKAVLSFQPNLSDKIYAGSDFFLMPSKFEPCGLSQMLAMRYGSVPIVRETGGLKDTVVPYVSATKEGNGFTFKTFDAYDMLDAVKRAVANYVAVDKTSKSYLDRITVRKNAMTADFSWTKSAKKYLEEYKSII
jgi:starch synthase